MRFTVYGAGSIGGILAAYLARAGEVAIVARSEHLDAIQKKGLTHIGLDGNHRSYNVVASDAADRLPPADLCFVTLKAHTIPDHAVSVAQALAPDGLAVFVQNGMPWWYLRKLAPDHASLLDPAGELSRRFPVCGAGVVSIGGRKDGPGIVRQTGGGNLILGRSDDVADGRLDAVASILTEAGLGCATSHDIAPAIWTKLLANVVLNSLAVLTRASIVDILDSKELRGTFEEVISEVEALASACGCDVAFDRDRQRSLVSSGQKSSTLQDVEAGNAIEFDALFGAVLALGDAKNLEITTTRTLASLIPLAVRTARGRAA